MALHLVETFSRARCAGCAGCFFVSLYIYAYIYARQDFGDASPKSPSKKHINVLYVGFREISIGRNVKTAEVRNFPKKVPAFGIINYPHT